MRGAFLLCAFSACTLVGCSLEQRCNSGVDQVDAAYRQLHNRENGRYKRAEAVVKAGMHVNEAQTQRATRNFEGCVESVESAEGAISRARDRLGEG